MDGKIQTTVLVKQPLTMRDWSEHDRTRTSSRCRVSRARVRASSPHTRRARARSKPSSTSCTAFSAPKPFAISSHILRKFSAVNLSFVFGYLFSYQYDSGVIVRHTTRAESASA